MGSIYFKALPNPLVYVNRLFVSKGYNVAFEFVWVFVTTLEKSCVSLTGTQNFFPCVLAHFLHYHLIERHKMTPKLSNLFSRLGRHSFRSFIRRPDSITIWPLWVRSDAPPRPGGRQK